MSKEYIKIEHSDWIEKYKPRMDHPDELTDVDPRMDNMSMETFKQLHKDNKIWTLIDAEPYPVITNGYHFVNRLEHYACEVAYEDDDLIEIN